MYISEFKYESFGKSKRLEDPQTISFLFQDNDPTVAPLLAPKSRCSIRRFSPAPIVSGNFAVRRSLWQPSALHLAEVGQGCQGCLMAESTLNFSHPMVPMMRSRKRMICPELAQFLASNDIKTCSISGPGFAE